MQQFDKKKIADVGNPETPTPLESANVGNGNTPTPLTNADVLNGWSLDNKKNNNTKFDTNFTVHAVGM